MQVAGRAGRQLGMGSGMAPEEVNNDDQSSGPGQGREGLGFKGCWPCRLITVGWPCRVELAVNAVLCTLLSMSALLSGTSVVERR